MRCERCNSPLPADSRTCRVCGATVTSKTEEKPPSYAQPPATKTVFCRACGMPIDDQTRRCTGCGKQYFRGVKPMLFLCVVLILALLALTAVCVVQERCYQERIGELERIVTSYQMSQASVE